ncbi:MAG: ArnT family glycosyltransferase [Fimbriimonadaceae bacterium]
MKLPGALYLILVTFLILTGVYNSLTPYRESGVLRYQRMADPVTGQMVPQSANDIGAPDERQHANYIAHLTEGKGFPVLKVGDSEAYENYQSHQPPLYYILAAGWSKITGAEPADPGSGFRLRFLNSVIGLAGLLGIYFAGIWGLQRQDIALAATAFAALLPMNVALHAAISNDPLLYALVTWVFALAVKGLQQGWSLKLALIIGAITGLAILTKTTGLVCIPVIATALLMRDPDPERRPKNAAFIWAAALGTGILIALPWLLRNKGLYGDFFAVSVFNAAFTGSPQASTFIEMFGGQGYWLNMVLWWTARSFIGAFGYMDIFLFDSMRTAQAGSLYSAIFLITGGIAFFGQIGFREIKAEADDQALPQPKRFQILHLVLLTFTTLLFIRFNLQYFQGQARYLFPAMVSFAYLFAFGSVRLMKAKPQLAFLVPTIILGLLNFAAIQAITSGFPLRQP